MTVSVIRLCYISLSAAHIEKGILVTHASSAACEVCSAVKFKILPEAATMPKPDKMAPGQQSR
jgi:hypothetical protein